MKVLPAFVWVASPYPFSSPLVTPLYSPLKLRDVVKKIDHSSKEEGWADRKNFRAPPTMIQVKDLTPLNDLLISAVNHTLNLNVRILKFWKSVRPSGKLAA